VVLQRNDLRSLRREEPRGRFADVAEALDGDARAVDRDSEPAHRFARDFHHAAAGRVAPAQASAHRHGFPGDDAEHRAPHSHGIGVHDPRHHLLVGADVGGGNIAVGAEQQRDLAGVASREALELRARQRGGSDPHAALRSSVGEIHHCVLHRHPRRERHDLGE
jgi:hypothetical protein